MTLKRYLATLPERLVRSIVGLGAGVAREVGDVALPKSVRESRLYQNLVDTTLRFLIEQVGEVEGAYGSDSKLADDFLARRTVGNAVEALGIVAFRASPVWVLAALADVCGLGRHLIPEIAASLKEQGLLDADTEFTSVDQLLDGLERTSARLAQTINTPPLDVPALREEWRAIREEAKSLTPERLPSGEALIGLWGDLKAESARQEKSVYQTSSMLALSAVRALPQGARWLGASAVAGATRTGQILAASLLDQYRATLSEIQQVGYAEVRDQAVATVRACCRVSVLTGEVHADRASSRSPREEVPMNRRLRSGVLVCAVLGSVSLTRAQGPPAPAAPSAASAGMVTPGELVIEPPTLLNLGFEWFIQGDANRNAAVQVSYRKAGTSDWKAALPLLAASG